jgi:hypothetical protein
MTTRKLFVGALIAAVLGGVACIATLIEPQWFELIFSESPDGGDGSLETIVAIFLSLGAVLFFGLLAWRRRRRDQHRAADRAVSVEDVG